MGELAYAMVEIQLLLYQDEGINMVRESRQAIEDVQSWLLRGLERPNVSVKVSKEWKGAGYEVLYWQADKSPGALHRYWQRRHGVKSKQQGPTHFFRYLGALRKYFQRNDDVSSLNLVRLVKNGAACQPCPYRSQLIWSFNQGMVDYLTSYKNRPTTS